MDCDINFHIIIIILYYATREVLYWKIYRTKKKLNKIFPIVHFFFFSVKEKILCDMAQEKNCSIITKAQNKKYLQETNIILKKSFERISSIDIDTKESGLNGYATTTTTTTTTTFCRTITSNLPCLKEQ